MLLLPKNMFSGVSSVVTITEKVDGCWCDGQMNKNIPLPLLCFYFLCYIINTRWKFLWLGNLAGDFLGDNFWFGNFFWILFEGLGILGVLNFAPTVNLNSEHSTPPYPS